MPLVYLVIDHWSNFEDLLYSVGVRRFFVTSPSALKIALEKGCDIIVDNGAYRYGCARLGWCLQAAKLGVKYILPDVLGDPKKTVELHIKFADMVGERELSNGFVVLQGATFEENVNQLEKLRELGIVKKYVAFGGPKELRRKKSLDEEIISKLYRYVKRYGYHFHVLGRARMCCDSFDTASWGYRMLDQKRNNNSYSIDPVLKFTRKYEGYNSIMSYLY